MPQEQVGTFEKYVSGLVGGVAGIVVGQPLDTIKIRLQTQPGVYSGALNCFTTMWKSEGIQGLFKGMSSPLFGICFINMAVFGVQNQTLSYFPEETMQSHLLSGMFAGAVQAFITSPMELAKTQMQIQGINQSKTSKSIKYHSSRAALVNIYKAGGLRGTYRGLTLTLVRDAPAFGAYFATYDILTSTIWPMNDDEGKMSLSNIKSSLLGGGFAGVASWIITYPVDVTKSCLQADSVGGTLKYKGVWDCCCKLYKAEGAKVFVRGLTPTLVRAFPVNAATFTGVSMFDELMIELRKYYTQKRASR